MSRVIEVRNQLAGISRINSMMQAMQVVAVVQLRQAQSRETMARHMRRHFDRLVGRLKLPSSPASLATVERLFVGGSDRGFCGDFNDKLATELKKFLAQQKMPETFEIVVLGNRGGEKFRQRGMPKISRFVPNPVVKSKELIGKEFLAEARQAWQDFQAGRIGAVYVLYNEFHSMLSQNPRLVQVFPLIAASEGESSLLCEPDEETVRHQVAEYYLQAVFNDVFMQSRLGEVAVRLMTMRGATENSKEMISALRIKLNKARQAAITFELSEIASSFEILKEGE